MHYSQEIKGIKGLSLLDFDPHEASNFQYVIMEVGAQCPVTRDQIVEALHAENVLARKYFWPGCHRMKPFLESDPLAHLVLPVTEAVSDRVIVLPTGTAVGRMHVDVIGEVLRALVGQ